MISDEFGSDFNVALVAQPYFHAPAGHESAAMPASYLSAFVASWFHTKSGHQADFADFSTGCRHCRHLPPQPV